MTETEIIERPIAAPAQTFGAIMLQLIRDPQIPADKLQILAKMQQDNIEAEQREAYHAAFVAFSAEAPVVERDGMVDMGAKGRFPFSTYEQIDKIIRPLLVKNGLAVQFWASDTNDVNLIPVHGSLFGHGWERVSTYPVPPDTGPGRNALQARSSSITYAKRTLVDMLCNIVRKGIDDDARRAMQASIDPKQVAELARLMKATKTNEASFLKAMITGVEKIDDVSPRDYARVLMVLQAKLEKGQK